MCRLACRVSVILGPLWFQQKASARVRVVFCAELCRVHLLELDLVETAHVTGTVGRECVSCIMWLFQQR